MIGKDTLPDTKINGKPIIPTTAPISLALAKNRQVIAREIVFERQDGKVIHLKINSAPIHNRKGKVIAAASIISDVTEAKEMEKRKDDFINMASHELKTPITSMRLYLEILLNQLSKDKNEKTKKLVKSIHYQTDRLQELVNDLLDVSRLQTGKLTFAKEEFRLDELIKQTAEELQGITKNQTITILAKTPVTVVADRFRIYQVFTNLITNAVKYSPEGKEINVSVKKQDGKALVSVSDQGIGITKDQQKKIFERLYQVSNGNEKTYSGLGMGLYISREIIRRHHGAIWVESEKGKGSTFFFSLPLKAKRK